jgi:hypothetical protein
MKRSLWLVAGLLVQVLSPTLPALADGIRSSHASPLEGAKALDKPVTYTETKIPLGELVQKVAADTGVTLTAAPGVADEPVAVVVKAMPARELLEQLADLLDYQWARHPGHRTPNTERPTPILEIWQDLASKQREAALREARIREDEQRFQREVRRCAEVAALSPEQIEAIAHGRDPQSEALHHLTREQQMAFLGSPEAGEQMQRPMTARRLSAPIPRALAQFLGRLSPEQWAMLRQEQRLSFSTDPQPGDLPLPKETADVLRSSRSSLYGPGETAPSFDPKAAERVRQREQEMQEQWAAATGYEVTIRLDAGSLTTAGAPSLSVDASAVQRGTPSWNFAGAGGTHLSLSSRPMPLWPPPAENTAQRQAAREKAPVVGVKRRFTVEAPPHTDLVGRRPEPGWVSRDLLPDLARIYDVSIISDAYTKSASGLFVSQSFPSEPTALSALLDRLAGGYEWDHQGRLIRMRSRTWFLERPREIPLRLARRWKAMGEQYGALPFEEYVRMVTELSDGQLEGLTLLAREVKLPVAAPDLNAVYPARHALRLYASLSPAEKQALWRGDALPVARLAPAQRELFRAALRERNRDRTPPLDLRQWAAGSISISAQPLFRTIEQHENSIRIQTGAAPAGGAPAETAPRAPDRAPAAAPGPRTPAPPPSPAAPPPLIIRGWVKQIDFLLQCGPQARQRVGITAALPS